MDAEDHRINLHDFLKENKGLYNFFLPICTKVVEKEYNDVEEALQELVSGVTVEISSESLAEECETRDMSASFIDACFNDDQYKYWEGYDYADNESAMNALKYDLSDEAEEYIKSLGYDLENPNEDLLDVVKRACDDAWMIGAENECLKDYYIAMDDAIENIEKELGKVNVTRSHPFGNSNPWDGTGSFIFTFVRDEDDLPDVFDLVQRDEDSDDLYENVKYVFAEGFDFNEPQYGWNDFDEDTFNQYIMDFLEPNNEGDE